MLNQQLNLKIQQKLSPLQIQVIKMLEYPAVELEERIREEMISNPALEADESDMKHKDGEEYTTDNEEYAEEKRKRYSEILSEFPENESIKKGVSTSCGSVRHRWIRILPLLFQ